MNSERNCLIEEFLNCVPANPFIGVKNGISGEEGKPTVGGRARQLPFVVWEGGSRFWSGMILFSSFIYFLARLISYFSCQFEALVKVYQMLISHWPL